MYLSIESGAQPPHFKECAKHPVIEEAGFVLYYTDQCPYTYYWVPKVQEAAKEHGIPFKVIHITDKESSTECTCTGHDLCTVSGRSVSDTEYPVR